MGKVFLVGGTVSLAVVLLASAALAAPCGAEAVGDGSACSINVWTSHGPEGAGILALAIDPSTPTTLYAGTDRGLYKSTDAGATWNAAYEGLPSASNGALTVDRVAPSTLYAGTYGSGVFESTDAGAIWAAANVGMPNAFVSAIAIDPITPNTLYATTSTGVFKSTDAGTTWGPTG